MAEGTGGKREGGDKSSKVDEVFFGCGDADPSLEVVLEGIDERGLWERVSKDAVVDARAKGVDDFGWGGEVHVGYPEGIKVGAAVPFE